MLLTKALFFLQVPPFVKMVVTADCFVSALGRCYPVRSCSISPENFGLLSLELLLRLIECVNCLQISASIARPVLFSNVIESVALTLLCISLFFFQH